MNSSETMKDVENTLLHPAVLKDMERSMRAIYVQRNVPLWQKYVREIHKKEICEICWEKFKTKD